MPETFSVFRIFLCGRCDAIHSDSRIRSVTNTDKKPHFAVGFVDAKRPPGGVTAVEGLAKVTRILIKLKNTV